MDPEIIYIVVSLIAGSIIITRIIVGRNGPKKATKSMNTANDRAVMDHYKTLLEINEDQKVTIKSLRGKVQRASQLDDDEPEVDPQELIKQAMPMIQAAAKKYNIPPDKLQGMLNSPQVQEWISNPKNLKKLNEYLPLLGAFTGSQQGTEQAGSIPSTDA